MSASADATRWANRVTRGLCGRCGEPRPPGWLKTSCPPCLEAVADRLRKAHWRKKGIVPPPRRRPYRPISVATHETPKQRYDRRRAAGDCTACGSPAGGKQLCDRHVHLRKIAMARRDGLIAVAR